MAGGGWRAQEDTCFGPSSFWNHWEKLVFSPASRNNVSCDFTLLRAWGNPTRILLSQSGFAEGSRGSPTFLSVGPSVPICKIMELAWIQVNPSMKQMALGKCGVGAVHTAGENTSWKRWDEGLTLTGSESHRQKSKSVSICTCVCMRCVREKERDRSTLHVRRKKQLRERYHTVRASNS